MAVLYEADDLSIFFGNKESAVYPSSNLQSWQKAKELLPHTDFAFLKHVLTLDALAFAHQVHGIEGLKACHTTSPFIDEADFVHTNQPGIGIGILTADCVPIILYDATHQAIAIVHAGWKGIVQDIIKAAYNTLCTTYHTQVHQLRVFIGPSARSCCYQVNQDFVYHFTMPLPAEHTLRRTPEALFFDLPLYAMQQLIYLGVSADMISTDYMLCTICNEQFYSYRRDKEKAGRQMTVAVLKSNKWLAAKNNE